jgi:hypothetical protein
MSKYKRQYRQWDDESKEKLSQANKGKHKSVEHKNHISQAMIKYWEGVPSKPISGETM